MSWAKLAVSMTFTEKQKRLIREGKNPFEFSRVRQYAPLKTRRKRIRAVRKVKRQSSPVIKV